VKVFGKKTMALVMAVAMMLSLCCVNVNAAEKPTAIEIEGTQDTMGVGEVLELTLDFTPSNASKTVIWKSSDTKIATVSSKGKVTGKKAGEVTITVTAKNTTPAVEASFTVEVKDVTEVRATDITVGYGTALSTVKSLLKAQTVELVYGDGADEYYEGTYEGAWKAPTDYNKGKTRDTFTFAVDDDDLEGTVEVTVADIDLMEAEDATLDAIYIPVDTKYSTGLLPSEVSLQLNNSTAETTLTIGSSKTKDFEAWDGPITSTKEKFEEAGTYEYTTTLREKDNWAEITLTQPVVVYDNTITDIELDAEDSYIYMDDAADYINDAMTSIFGSEAELHHIEITKITGYNADTDKSGTSFISGTLYTDGDCDTKVSAGDEEYSAEAFEDMCFVANGKGKITVVEYTAYADEDGKQALKGTIYIDSAEFMILEMEVNNSDVLDFDSGEFSSAFKSLDKNYTLDYVVFDNNLYSSEGELYYKYDTKSEEVVDDEWYYVKASSKDDELDLDDVSFVPDDDAKGIITIEFTAYGYDDDDDEVDATGVIQINVLDEADIVITAGIEEKVPVDIELFEEYLDDEADTDDIAYIVFDGAPYTTSSGYLVSGTKSFKSSGDKTFHMDPDKDEYDLEDLYFVGGDSKTSKRAEFEIYYFDDDDDVEDDPVTGTVEFVTDISTNVYTKDPLDAAQVLKFSSSISAFEKVGGQENEYFKFTSLPKDAKLYYNYGMSTQADVKTGEAYYLGSVSGSKKALKNITFVPSYSSSKQQQVITFEYKAYDEDGNAVSGACFFEVKYATKSAYFSDITTKTYADSVDFLKNQGITTGTTATTFGPNNNVTRGQFVTFLWRAAGSPTVTGVTNKFTDVKSTGDYAYAYQAILWAVQNNITTGRSATIFDPAANVTHQELLTFLYRYDVNYLKHSGAASTSVSYADFNSVADYAKTAVKWADNKGILDGNTIQPTNAGIRATVALWMHRMLTL